MAGAVTMTLIGDKELQARLRKAAVVAPTLTSQALQAEARRVMEIAQGLAPVLTGDLRASGFVEGGGDIGPRGGGLQVTVGFRAHYAIIQHERTDYNHPNGGQAKFLEEPMMQAQDGLEQRMQRTLYGVFEL